MGKYNLVESSLRIKNLVVPNRIVFPPFVTGYSNPDGSIGDRQIRFYKSLAKGGVGMIIVGATAIAPEGIGWMGNTRIDRDDHINGLKKLFQEIKSDHGVAGIQIYHCGISTNERRTGGLPLVAPSPLSYSDQIKTAHELSIEEINRLEAAFVKGIERAFMAGADFVEIHGAHGYLINQFLSPLTNKRSDEYGGSLVNRARFAINIIEGARNAVGKDAVIGIRIGADEFSEGGYTLEQSKPFCKWFVDKGVDFIHVSAGMTEKGVQEMYNGAFVKLSSEIKKVVNVPVICVGAIKNMVRAEQILSEGSADLVALGRALVADPELVNKSFNGEEEDIVECLDCWECISTMGDDNGDGMQCSQNPDLP